jgi:hypothetical protein
VGEGKLLNIAGQILSVNISTGYIFESKAVGKQLSCSLEHSVLLIQNG